MSIRKDFFVADLMGVITAMFLARYFWGSPFDVGDISFFLLGYLACWTNDRLARHHGE